MNLKNKISLVLPLVFLSTACNENKVKPAEVTPSKTIAVGKVIPANFDSSKLNGVKVSLKSDTFSILGNIMDSATQKTISKKITVTIDGADKDKVEKSNYDFDSGSVSIKLKKDIIPSDNNPINLTIVAKADGYFSSSTPLQIKNEKAGLFTMNLVDLKNPPVGVVALENKDNKVDDKGALTEKISMTINEPKSNTNLSINLRQTTIISDAKGQPLQGKIKADIGFFNNQSPTSFSSFPGGLNNANVNINGKNKDGYFITGGFTSIELTDEKGTKASTFSEPMEITMQLPKGTINPDTGLEIKEGDKIGIWSYDTTTGEWKYEAEGLVGALGADNNFTVKYSATHLSYWNLDWHSSDKCDPKLRLIWNGSPIPVQVTANFQGQYWSYPNTLRDEVNDLFNVPTDREINFVAKFGNKEVGSTKVKLGSACPEIKLNINSENLPVMREIPVYVYVKSKTEFTFDEIRALADKFNVSEEQKNIMFDYFKTNNIKEPVALTSELIDNLERKGVMNLRGLKSVLDQKVNPDAQLYDSVENPYTWNSFNIVGGKSSIRAMDGEKHGLSTYFYYKNKEYSIYQNVEITANTKEIILEKIDTDLTIEIVKDYFKKMGIDFEKLKLPA